MLRHAAERRAALRVGVSCKLDYAEQGTEQNSEHTSHGTLNNLSTTGLAFQTNEQFKLGTLLDVRLDPGNTLIAPLDATIEIIRVDTAEDLSGYNIAGRITQINH
ncbi:MAG: PilZ domain-containing protein [Gammaproteobacteria bacterium]|nr:PilZ domain-containing protein [Gammaproteobacteria bacterium]